MNFLSGHTSSLLSALRLMSGLLFLQHGTTKYLSLPPSDFSGVAPLSLPGIAGMIELATGLLIAVGLFTRPAAFLASGTMAAAYFLAHAPQNFYPILNGGELAVLYCFVFLYLAAAGGGRFSVDALLGRA
ncbi:DoxX family protein [Pannonibacter sp. SL95]|jgi:putative oxidoreductase|uniref:DoxX family protein n=1 Tax=Pannonibacter sp. SL95 TaxID=2995153 RepID=UPI002274FD1D|nr:DoxX family protein [Pannonibacter sp. SL95]MCY1705456.1 DoxX family protein [Pannonibacter sp. SL95]